MISNCFSLISIDLSNFNNQYLDLYKIFGEPKGYIYLNYINLYNSVFSLDKIFSLSGYRLMYAISKTLYICTKEDIFSNCDEKYEESCEIAKYLVKICCNNGNENSKCGTFNEDNYVIVNYNNAFSYGSSKFFNYDNSRINLERIFLDNTQL